MKNLLKKVFNSADAEKEKETVEMTTNNNSADLLAQATTALADKQAQLTNALAEVENLKQLLANAQSAELQAQEQAKQLKTEARKNKIVEAVGTEKADALLAATEGLEDAAFEAVVKAMTVNLDAEAKTEAFQEVGKVAKPDAEAIDSIESDKNKESDEAKLLKAKYKSK